MWNGDNFDDLIIGAPLAHHNRDEGPGSVYVVNGGENMPATVDLADIDAGDNGQDPNSTVSTVEDRTRHLGRVVGDMTATDIRCGHGAPPAHNNGRFVSRLRCTSFSTMGRRQLFLTWRRSADKGYLGLRIDGAAGFQLSQSHPGVLGTETGEPVAGIGDVNGDGRPNVAVGVVLRPTTTVVMTLAQLPSSSERPVTTTRLTLQTLTTLLIPRASVSTAPKSLGLLQSVLLRRASAYSIAGTGNVSGDSHSDLIIGAPFIGRNERPFAGSAYVVNGRANDYGTIDLNWDIKAPGNPDGYQIFGATGCDSPPTCVGDWAGSSVSGAGDLNDDGCSRRNRRIPLRRQQRPRKLQGPRTSSMGRGRSAPRRWLYKTQTAASSTTGSGSSTSISTPRIATGLTQSHESHRPSSHVAPRSPTPRATPTLRTAPVTVRALSDRCTTGVETNCSGSWADDFHAGTLSFDVSPGLATRALRSPDRSL